MSKTKRHIKIFDQSRNEVIQCYLRMGLIAIVLLAFAVLEVMGRPIDNRQAYFLVFGYLVWVICYYILVKTKPQACAAGRILIIMLADILATAFVMYLAGPLSALFVPLFLWYIIGYGMRFGLFFALVATMATVASWIGLTVLSPYWRAHPYNAGGWLIAFVLIPSYYFLLVKRLHLSLRELNIALQKTEKLACRDTLTQLANRNHFNQQAENLLSQFEKVAILLIDLDGFKSINDLYGHNIGDQVLVAVAKSLKECCGSNRIVGRLGGDEFIIALTYNSVDEIMMLAERSLSDIAGTTANHGKITASIGICCCPQDAQDLSHAKSLADSAMYTAKKQGKNRYCFYADEAVGNVSAVVM